MYEMKMMVSNSHINKNKEMKVTAIINAIQDIEGIHIENLGDFTKYINDNNIGIFLTYRQIDIIKRPVFNSEIKIITYPYNTNSVSGYRQIYIEDSNNNLLIKSIAFGAFVDLATNKTKRLPKDVIKEINDGVRDEQMDERPRKIDYSMFEFKEVETLKIRKSNIDRYNHLNNAYYVEFAENVLKDTYKYNRIRAEYLNPLIVNDIMRIEVSNEINNSVIIRIKDLCDNVSAIIEFSFIMNLK